MDLKELGEVDPSSHWYYQSKVVPLRREVARLRGGPLHLMDVGAGSGFFSMALADPDMGDAVVCVDTKYPSDIVGSDGPVQFVREATADQVRAASALLFIDVLEHVDDDRGFLAGYVERATPGSLVLITVPAFMSMWSAHDEFLEHRRRYSLRQVEAVAQASGLDVLRGRYLFGVIFPIAWVVRRLRRGKPARSDLAVLPGLLNRALRLVLGLEHRLSINRLAGLTAFVVARVPTVDDRAEEGWSAGVRRSGG